MRTAPTVAALALLFTGVSGCGDDEPPTNASVSDFCDNFTEFGEDMAEFGSDSDPKEVVEVVKDLREDMLETGTPEDIPDDALAGFEVTMDAIGDLDDDASEEDIASLDADLSDAERENTDAFDEYVSETCGQ